MKINLMDLSKFLSDNNLGIYFVSDPIKEMPVQDGGSLFQVNTVHLDEFLSKLTTYVENNTEPK